MGGAGLPEVVGDKIVSSSDPDVGDGALGFGVFLSVLGYCCGLIFP